jgi:hypothetical protein
MPMTAPPILCKHPMLTTLEALAANSDALGALIDSIRNGTGTPDGRLDAAVDAGLFASYSDGQKSDARGKLLSAWGDSATLLRISDALGKALDLVRKKNWPLRCWWAAGATQSGIDILVDEGKGDEAIYFVLLTPAMGVDVAADKGFDAAFKAALQLQSAALKTWTDSFTPHS